MVKRSHSNIRVKWGVCTLLCALAAGLCVPCGAIAPSTVLKRVEERWGQLERLQVDLWQSVENLNWEDTRHYAGALYIQYGEQLRLDYQLMNAGALRSATEAPAWIQSASFSPDDIFRADRDYLWHLDRRAQIVTRQYLSQSGLPPLIRMLAGAQQFQSEQFREEYDIRPVEEEDLYGQPTYQIAFRPKGGQEQIQPYYWLWVHQETYLPVRLQVQSRDESIQVDFFHLRTDDPLPENIFDLRVPQDIQFIDRTLDL